MISAVAIAILGHEVVAASLLTGLAGATMYFGKDWVA